MVYRILYSIFTALFRLLERNWKQTIPKHHHSGTIGEFNVGTHGC
jgi:hypothetical protein